MTRSAWWLFCDAIAVYRLAILVSQDEIFRPLREWVGKKGKPLGRVRHWCFYLITCPWCLSVYFAAAAIALTKFVPSVWQYGAMGLALSGVAGYLAERTNH